MSRIVRLTNEEGSNLDPRRRRERGRTPTPVRRREVEPADQAAVIKLLPAQVEACSPEQWQRAIGQLADMLLPLATSHPTAEEAA